MKKYLFCLTCLLSCSFAFAQQKKSVKKADPPPKVAAVPQPEQAPAGGYEHPPVVMPVSDMSNIRATQKNGETIRINKPEELAKIDLSRLKALSMTTRLPGQILDGKILQQILGEAKELELLEIDHFLLDTFPEIKAPHLHLKKLVLNDNQLDALPESIGQLQALEVLHILNKLQQLPASFATLKNMKELVLDGTEFSIFPAELFALSRLSLLYVSGPGKGGNKIKELPDLFQKLPGLKELGITKAALSSIPASIGKLEQLNKVDFSYNLFAAFPEALVNSTHLEFVSFSANPLKWNAFLASIKKLKWHGLFFLHETGLSKQQYETVQRILHKTDVYYDGMND